MEKAAGRAEHRGAGGGMAATARYWFWVAAAVLLRVALIGFSGSLKLDTRPEVATPLTSLRRRRAVCHCCPSVVIVCVFFVLPLIRGSCDCGVQWRKVTG